MEQQQPRPEQKLKGALLTFIVLQLVYLFFFFSTFPDSFRNALDFEQPALALVASWLSSLTMLGYCVACLISVAQLVMRRATFLLWFQVSGAIALIGNFIVFVLRQVAASVSDSYYTNSDYYWVLFIMALFWTLSWCMFFARSSRVFSYMGEDPGYLRVALFTKNVKAPAPWEEPRQVFAAYRPPVQPTQNVYAAAPPAQGAYPAAYPPVGTPQGQPPQPQAALQPQAPQAYYPPAAPAAQPGQWQSPPTGGPGAL